MPSNRKPGRPVEKQPPPPIPDTPENIAHAVLSTPPKQIWRHMRDEKPKGGEGG